jgi:hypothetical protein
MRSFVTCTFTNVVKVFKSRRMSRAGHVARMGEEMSAEKKLPGKNHSEGKHRWENKIRMDLREEGW